MLTLAIDTSTKTASIALLDDDMVLAEVLISLNLHHCATLLPAMENLTRMAGITPGKVDLLVCTIGPGLFTGLRIGVSTVKGLALTTGRPVVGVSTLDALALNLVYLSMTICPMLDAGKKHVYTAIYKMGRKDIPEKIGEEMIANVGKFLENLDKDEDIIFVGDGAVKHRELIKEILPERSFLAFAHHQFIRAAAVGMLGRRKFNDGDILDSVTFTPRYLRPFGA
ncbi:MAG: tRNA (adenosine(37)-N6)-threonylcarbamoyltransferase complex dimerization subunit type 1 TsaB [Syntrophales bacterium]|nr:tRNA (adenosine(37)-N6)-threonylcarbamoyltransferase complex dimerization subunit type 1 TsaB [Syntrophales bacterium]